MEMNAFGALNIYWCLLSWWRASKWK